MSGHSDDEIREEMERLLKEQWESLKRGTFVGFSGDDLRQEEERLKRIRELSADYLAALKRNRA
jgi:hypothetical protein